MRVLAPNTLKYPIGESTKMPSVLNVLILTLIIQPELN